MGVTLGRLAGFLGAELHGDPDEMIRAVAPLHLARTGEISFLANRRYSRHLRATRASAVILSSADAGLCPVATLVLDNPYLGYARAAALFNPEPPMAHGVHDAAWVSPAAMVADSAWIGPHATVEAGAEIGERAAVGPGCAVGESVRVGADARLGANVTLVAGVRLGARVRVHPGAVLGADGFGIANDRGNWVKVPQLGGVLVGDDVEIGANSTIDRGALEDTVIEEGVKIDNLVQIGHNVRIGACTAIAGCVAIAGSVRIGRGCTIAGCVAIAGHLEIADDVHLTGGSLVHRSIDEPGVYSSGIPARENRLWRRNQARFHRLDEMARRLRALEQK